ncbi:protein kintoun-like [Panicum miliaceum]|uniref:Protein kintoun-like n=1 Tax=Panicum miliaceum TaxID=4540 RepID=A0A3L6RPF0_PANMI|nr:protein kintoun-like [Panicum miliaceum]
MAAATEEEFTDAELEVAAILCDLKKTLRARDRRRRRRMQRLQAAPEIPSWGRRRPRSMPEEKPATPAPVPAPVLPASGVAERDGAASPDTPLAYPDSGGDDAPMEEEDAKKPTSHDQWVQEQHGVVASLSQENAHLLMVKREQEEQEQARKRPRVAAQAPGAADPRAAAAALGLDLNEPARAPEEDEQARARAQAAAVAAAAAAEWYRHARLRAAMEKAAGARRRRLEILRAKVACPLVSSRSRPRRAG